jgi:predicted PurR-regulated permease PerM
MADLPQRTEMVIPRWVQLVSLPLILLGAWQLLIVLNHAVFIFVIAALIAILLNPIVRAFCALRVPRGVAVLLVYLLAAFVFLGVFVIVGTVVTNESRVAINRVDDEFTNQNANGKTAAQIKLDRLQHWVDTKSPYKFDVKTPGDKVINDVSSLDLQQYTGRAVSIAQDVVVVIAESLFNLVLVIVMSVYMLLDAPRLSRWLRGVFHSTDPSDDLMARVERALLAYVRGQTLVSLVVGGTATVGMWLLGVSGIFPSGETYALAFGAFTAVTEIIPYIGPWLGALAPLLVAATYSPGAVLAVALVYLFIHQIEGHIVIPKLMGGAVRVHPLAVIFALLAGEELYGFAGILITLPLVAIGREVGAFLRERISLRSWSDSPW